MFKQIEILIGGSNPEAHGPLNDAETARVRAALTAGEQFDAFVRGRVLHAGAGLWVLTNTRLLTLDMRAGGGVERSALAGLRGLELQRGKYGYGIALQAAGGRRSLFSADAGLTLSFAAALAQRSSAWRAGSPLPAIPADEAAEVMLWTLSSQARLHPERLLPGGSGSGSGVVVSASALPATA